MIKSMTGFGRCEIVTTEYKITVEMKAVNHRYLDLSIRMPKKFNYFEAAIRNLLKTYIQRGKVDVFINYEDKQKEVKIRCGNSTKGKMYVTDMDKNLEYTGEHKLSELIIVPKAVVTVVI